MPLSRTGMRGFKPRLQGSCCVSPINDNRYQMGANAIISHRHARFETAPTGFVPLTTNVPKRRNHGHSP